MTTPSLKWNRENSLQAMKTVRACHFAHVSHFINLTLFSALAFSNPSFASKTTTSETSAPSIAVFLEGIPADIKKNILSQLSLEQHKNKTHSNIEKIEFMHRRAFKEIELACQPFGYYETKIEGFLEFDNGVWAAHYAIELGKPVKVTELNIEIEGPLNNELSRKSLQGLFTLKLGENLNHEIYDQGKKNILIQAINLGYNDAKFVQNKIEVNPETHSSKILLKLDSGPKYYVGSIEFPREPFDPIFLQKYVPYKLHTPLSPKALFDLQNNLSQSGYFTQVDVEPNFEDKTPNHYVPLSITLNPVKPNEFLSGFGYGTDTGARAKLGWERRYLNRYGHQVFVTSFFSKVTQQMEARYKVPANRPNTDFYQIKGMVKHERFDHALDQKEYTTQELGLNDTHEYKRWQRVTSLNWHIEKYKDSKDAAWEHKSFLLPSLLLAYGKLDNAIRPTKGYRINLVVTGSLNTLLSSSTFIQTHLKAKYLKPMAKDLSFLLRSEVGATTPNVIDKIPLSLRFFAGGDQSIRGFNYKSLGPTTKNANNQDVVTGGTYLVTGSAEMIYRIKDPFAVSAFWDIGNAMKRFKDPLESSLGLGFRWNTKIGDIKLEFARPITLTRSHFRVHFSFGPDL